MADETYPYTHVHCELCHRVVPVAPGHFQTSVPHLPPYAITGVLIGALTGDGVRINICAGNEKRQLRDGLHASAGQAVRLAQQHAILADDAYWEGL